MWFRTWIVNFICMKLWHAIIHFMNPWCFIVNWTIRNKLQWNLSELKIKSAKWQYVRSQCFNPPGAECFTITRSSSWLLLTWFHASPGPRFNIKMSSYQYRKSHCRDKTVVRSSYLHNGISCTGKVSSLYWIRDQVTSNHGIDYAGRTVPCFPPSHSSEMITNKNAFPKLNTTQRGLNPNERAWRLRW